MCIHQWPPSGGCTRLLWIPTREVKVDVLLLLAVDVQKPTVLVPTPVNLVKYIEDPDYEHEDFNLSAAGTLRARVRM